MVETGTFTIGIVNEAGQTCREFILHERTFRHTLEIGHDPDINAELISSSVYYDAAIYSKRLKVAGIDNVTPEMILDLEGPDADELSLACVKLDKRRTEFRRKQQTASQTVDSAGQAGDPLGGGPKHASGRRRKPAAKLPGDRRPQA